MTSIVSLMIVDEGMAMAQSNLGGDLEVWDYLEEQRRGGPHRHTIVTHSSTTIWSK